MRNNIIANQGDLGFMSDGQNRVVSPSTVNSIKRKNRRIYQFDALVKSAENEKIMLILKNITRIDLDQNHGRSQDFFRGKYFSKFFKKFLRKLRKMHYFCIFSKKLANHALIFRAFGRKPLFVGNFEKMFDNFLRKIA